MKTIPTKESIYFDYKMNKIIKSKKTVLKLDILMFCTVLAGIVGIITIF